MPRARGAERALDVAALGGVPCVRARCLEGRPRLVVPAELREQRPAHELRVRLRQGVDVGAGIVEQREPGCRAVGAGDGERAVHPHDRVRAMRLEVAESDGPIVFMRWVTRIEPDGAGTRITQALEYQVKTALWAGSSISS